VAVFARAGFLSSEVRGVTFIIPAPGPQPRAESVPRIDERLGPETDSSTIVEGNAQRSGADLRLAAAVPAFSVHVKVRGVAGVLGKPGKFKAVYRVFWSPPADGCEVPTDCSQGRVLCAGRCTDLSSDRNNCGSCGRVCPNSEPCGDGKCGSTSCPGGPCSCVDGTPFPAFCSGTAGCNQVCRPHGG
jgi:hypothetical protein